LREVGDEWVAVEERRDAVGRGSSPQQALADLESGSGDTDGSGSPGDTGEPEPADESTTSGPITQIYRGERLPTVSPKLELLFAVAAVGFGGIYLVAGNVGGAILIAIGLMLLVRVAWIEYGLFGPKQ
jgi:hypothetical protein